MMRILQKTIAGFGLWLLVLFGTHIVRADNAVPISHAQTAETRATLFAHPAPLRAGPVRLEWMFQSADDKILGGEGWRAVLHAPEEGGTAWVPPCCRAAGSITPDGETLKVQTRGFLNASAVVLGESGRWVLQLHSEQGQVLTLPFEVAEAAAPWFQYWPFLAAPWLVLGLFGWHHILAWRRRGKTSNDFPFTRTGS